MLAGYEAIDRLLHPRPVSHLWAVAAAAIIGFAGNEIVARYRIRVGRRIGSAALVADGLHARTDGFTSLAVLLGAGRRRARLAPGRPGRRPAHHRRHPRCAALGRPPGRRPADGRRRPRPRRPGHRRPRRASTASATSDELRIRWIGHTLRAEADITVDPDLSLDRAHEIAHHAEAHLLTDVPRLTAATVHANPAGAHPDPVAASVALLCRGRQLEAATLAWNVIGIAILAIAALRAQSVALAGFGLDSLIEIGASTVVLWELSGTGEDRQRRALRLIAGAFLALAAYLTIQTRSSGHRPPPAPQPSRHRLDGRLRRRHVRPRLVKPAPAKPSETRSSSPKAESPSSTAAPANAQKWSGLTEREVLARPGAVGSHDAPEIIRNHPALDGPLGHCLREGNRAEVPVTIHGTNAELNVVFRDAERDRGDVANGERLGPIRIRGLPHHH